MSENSRKLDMTTNIGYAGGEMFNCMCQQLINSYMLIFYQAVMRLSNTNAGLILTICRISGGLSTLVVAFLSDVDKQFWIYHHYGKRKVITIGIIVLFNSRLMRHLSKYY